MLCNLDLRIICVFMSSLSSHYFKQLEIVAILSSSVFPF